MRVIVTLIILLLASGCSFEKGDKPLARGKGFGYDWTSANPKDVLRVSVQNSFTRDSFVALDGAGKHYELTVGPIKDAFMIVPKGNYEFSAWSFGKSVGNTKYDVGQDDRNGIKGVLVKIRP
jgi:hypothetical protein